MLYQVDWSISIGGSEEIEAGSIEEARSIFLAGTGTIEEEIIDDGNGNRYTKRSI